MMDVHDTNIALKNFKSEKIKYKLSLKNKTLLLITVAVVVACFLVSFIFLNLLTREMRDEMQVRGVSTAMQLASDSYYSLITEDEVLLEQLIQSRMAQPNIEYVIIEDQNGRVLRASDEKYLENNLSHNIYENLNQVYNGIVPFIYLSQDSSFEFSETVWQNNNRNAEGTGVDLGENFPDSGFNDLELDQEDSITQDNIKLGMVRVGFSLAPLFNIVKSVISVGIAISIGVAFLTVFIFYTIIQKKIDTVTLISRVAQEITDYSGQKVLVPTKELQKHAEKVGEASDEISELFFNFKDMLDQLNIYHVYMQNNADELRKTSQAKSDFLSTISHELRTPLNAIIGYCELLIMDYEEDELSTIDDAKNIRRSSQHLLRMINEVLDLSKMDVGKLDVYNEKLDIVKAVENAVIICEVTAKEHNNQIEVNIEPSLKIIRTDLTKLSQCLINLIGNACKFTKDGKVKVHVYSEKNELGTRIYFSIKDDGIGIAQDKLDHIFEPFSQGDSSITRKYGGTGLGLTVTRKIIKVLGGDIVVKSRMDKGSEFKFWLDADINTPV